MVTLRGIIEAEEQRAVAAEAGLTIARVCVRAGQKVEAGDVLAEYDREALRRVLEEKQAALQTLALQAQLEAMEPGAEPSSGGTAQPQSAASDVQRQIARQQLRDLETQAAQAEVDRLTQLLYGGATLTTPVSGAVSEVLVEATASGVRHEACDHEAFLSGGLRRLPDVRRLLRRQYAHNVGKLRGLLHHPIHRRPAGLAGRPVP